MSAPLLEVEHLGKAYPRAGDPRARLSALLRGIAGKPVARTPVLEDVGFQVRRGESLGIIGENGAGKSTLLKLVSGVLHPTSGRVVRSGSVGALLELGAGFDPERSGRDNIDLAGELMGLDQEQLRERHEAIVAFADIGRYIEEPVKHYSSGMTVRLGFAVIASVRPDLLITDEILAVGDESFQKKCIRWIEEYLDQGGTLLLVAHSMYHVQKLCRHALWLRDGRTHAYGDVFDVTQDYLAYHERKSARELGADIEKAYDGGEYRITAARLNGSEDTALVLAAADALDVEVEIFSPDGRAPQFAFGVVRADGTPVYGSSSEIEAVTGHAHGPRHVRYRVVLDLGPLLPGGYTLKLHATDPESLRLFDTVERGLTIRGATRELGMVRLLHRWEVPGA